MWQHHDQLMYKLREIYLKISKQTQNRLQEIFKVLDLDYDSIYNIADKRTKNMIDVKIVEWKDKKLLKGYFEVLANNIYNRTRVKNSEILELLIYSAYIEEQDKLEEYENQIIYDDMNYYYIEGQEDVNKSLPLYKRKEILTLTDVLFLSLLAMNDSSGYDFNTYKQIVIKNNTDKLYRQVIINVNQQKELDIDNIEFQNIIDRQIDNKVKISEDKIYGAIDHKLIELNNKVKLEGIKLLDKEAKVRFIAVEDNVTTQMCHSLNNQIFNVHDWNEFYRYSKSNDKIVKYRCFGLIPGLNMPPIDDGFHWCRSTLQYINITEKTSNLSIRKRILYKKIYEYNLKGISKLALLQNIVKSNKVINDFSCLKRKINNIKIESNTNYLMAIVPVKDYYSIYIDKEIFSSIKSARQNYEELIKLRQAPRGTTYKDVMTHELGHAVNYEVLKIIYCNNLRKIRFDWENHITSTNIVNKALDNIGVIDQKNKIKTISDLSKYALDSADETIAEAFADYYSNGINSKRISKEIIKIMKGMI